MKQRFAKRQQTAQSLGVEEMKGHPIRHFAGSRCTFPVAVASLLGLASFALMYMVLTLVYTDAGKTAAAAATSRAHKVLSSSIQGVKTTQDGAVLNHIKTMESKLDSLVALVRSGIADTARTVASAQVLAEEAAEAVAAAQAAKIVEAVVMPIAAAATPARRRNAILGMSKGVEFLWLYRFVRSARESMPGVDIVLFTDQPSLQGDGKGYTAEDYALLLKMYSVKTVLFDIDRDLKAHQRAYHPSSYRWILMREWLRGKGVLQALTGGPGAQSSADLPPGQAPEYDAVMFVDTRDTVFQGDIFDQMKEGKEGEGLYIFQEQKPRTIRECGWNSGWVKDCYGDTGLDKVGGFVISCSGTSMGTWSDVLGYVDALADALEDSKCERNGIDQGIHNYLVYSGDLSTAAGGKVETMHVISNEEGFIATVQSMPSLVRDRSGRVLNDKGTPVAAVHQYDRSPLLLQQFEKQYQWLRAHETVGK